MQGPSHRFVVIISALLTLLVRSQIWRTLTVAALG